MTMTMTTRSATTISYNVPFQLLEINVISAQDLAPVSRAMRTYAVASVHPERKLSTRVDTHGHTNPTWNDKFVFRVDDDFLRSDTSAVMIDIYAVRFFRDARVGTVRVLIGNLIPPSAKPHHNPSMRFVALQVRRPSGRPQGILNIGVTLLDSSMRSMPLYTQLSASAVGYRDLIGEESTHFNQPPNYQNPKIQLRRSRSETRESVKDGSLINGSDRGVPLKFVETTGSVWSESEVGPAPSAVGPAVEEGLSQTDDVGSSILEDWSVDDSSVEGLRSKLERWRTELPPIYDRGEIESFRSPAGHVRRHTDGGGGLFSCFGNAYGCEFSIICGANSNNTTKKKISNGKVLLSPENNLNRSFVLDRKLRG